MLPAFYAIKKGLQGLFVPFGYPAPLYHHTVIIRVLQVIIAYKLWNRIIPPIDLTKAQNCEYGGIVYFFA